MNTQTRWRRQIGRAALILGMALAAQSQFDAQSGRPEQEELEALVHEYTRLEDAGDMTSQSRLMAPERWWHGIGGRRTDNANWMKVQGEQFAANRRRYPGLQIVREVRDLKIRLLAPTVAVTSFVWFANRIIPGDLPADRVQALGPAPIPAVTSLVWLRGAEGWKIVSSHTSPLFQR